MTRWWIRLGKLDCHLPGGTRCRQAHRRPVALTDGLSGNYTRCLVRGLPGSRISATWLGCRPFSCAMGSAAARLADALWTAHRSSCRKPLGQPALCLTHRDSDLTTYKEFPPAFVPSIRPGAGSGSRAELAAARPNRMSSAPPWSPRALVQRKAGWWLYLNR